jgi:hypothetical protein
MSSIAGLCLGHLQASANAAPFKGSQRGGVRRSAIGVARLRVAAEAAGGEDGEGRMGKDGTGRRGSAQLERWARTRRIRSGRLGEHRKGDSAAVKVVKEAPSVAVVPEYESDEEDDEVQGKGVYMISDGTGWTADHAVQAALGQFEHCLVDRRCTVDTYLFSQVLKLGFRN